MATVKRSAVPIGTVIIWPVAISGSSMTDESGTWLLCNGQTISESDYPDLVSVLGSTSVPNYRGLFMRGYGSCTHSQINGTINGTSSTTHTSGELGEVQGDAMRELYGDVPVGSESSATNVTSAISGVFGYSSSYTNPGQSASYLSQSCCLPFFSASRYVPTADENRPVNTAVNYLIKAKHPE